MNKVLNIKMIIATQKSCLIPKGEMYLPLHVGAATSNNTLNYIRDDTGDQISERNPVFCELTGLYWAWKNLKYDWLGLVHYRRFFAFLENGKKKILTKEQLLPLLEQYRVILPQKRRYYIETVYSHYDHTFDANHFDMAGQVISEKFPDYAEDFERFMRQRSAWLFNMMIMPRELTEQYCSWLFEIMFELEKRVDTSLMNPFEMRYAGRVSERLLNVWIKHQLRIGKLHKEEIKELPYIYIGKINWWKKSTGFLMAKFLKKKYKASF